MLHTSKCKQESKKSELLFWNSIHRSYLKLKNTVIKNNSVTHKIKSLFDNFMIIKTSKLFLNHKKRDNLNKESLPLYIFYLFNYKGFTTSCLVFFFFLSKQNRWRDPFLLPLPSLKQERIYMLFILFPSHSSPSLLVVVNWGL